MDMNINPNLQLILIVVALVEDQNLFVRAGDFIQYGDLFYEIVKTYNDTRYYFGQVEHKFQVSAECVRARRGLFRVKEAITRPS